MMETYPLQATIATEDRFWRAMRRDERRRAGATRAATDASGWPERTASHSCSAFLPTKCDCPRPGNGDDPSPTARIIAVLTVQIHGDGLLLITGVTRDRRCSRPCARRYFQRQGQPGGSVERFRAVWALWPAAAAVLTGAGAGDLSDMALFDWREVTLAGQLCTVQRIEGVGGDALTVFKPAPQAEAVRSELQAAGGRDQR